MYWKPVYAILEGAFEIVVANAQHVKKVPGCKTDVKRRGIDRGLALPRVAALELRSDPAHPRTARLDALRRKLVESQTAECNRLLKLLETANIELASVATDVLGVAGRLMLEALVKAEAGPQEMAELAKARLREKIPALGTGRRFESCRVRHSFGSY